MKHLWTKFSAWASVLPILLLPATAMAQLTEAQSELTSVGTAIGTDATTNDLPALIGNLINVLLSVLGIIFVVLVVYAGFLYLTAAGEDEKVKKAKHLLTQSVIGLVIIIAAYAIATYVIDALSTAATTS
ncbi:hypothetical protein HZA87_05160 [Candidatus Uhrbacteria bacterium]|nr:hypothetical protein [Candidatus Uhrbacteria bacterium]